MAEHYATNADPRPEGGVGRVKWVLEAGRLRHLEFPEWHVRGEPAGVLTSNADLSALGV